MYIKVPICRSRDICTQDRKGVTESSGEFADLEVFVPKSCNQALYQPAVAALVVLINSCESKGVGLGAGGSGIGGEFLQRDTSVEHLAWPQRLVG